MIKAGSLFYAVVISLIIAIVSSSLILFAYLTRIQFDNFETEGRLNLNADSGLNLLMSDQNIIAPNDRKAIDLYGTGEDSVDLMRRSWGAFEVIASTTVFKRKVVEKIALVGYLPDSNHTYSIYLLDQDKPLAVCGKTKLKGTAYLPRSGVKRAYIEGQNFIGTDLISGPTKQSDKQLPPFNKTLLENIQEILSGSVSEDDSVIVINARLSADTIINGFKQKTIVLKSESPVVISEGVYSGNILITSKVKITVSPGVVLKDVILSAPTIVVEEHFRGNAQLFATDSLLVQKNATFAFPSVLGLLKSNNQLKSAAIVLNENDTLSGGIFTLKDDKYVLQEAGVVLNKKTVVTGQVYSNGYVDAEGTINGSLMTSKIILTTTSSVYENHLLNSIIDRTKLSPYFVGLNLVDEAHSRKIVKWLN